MFLANALGYLHVKQQVPNYWKQRVCELAHREPKLKGRSPEFTLPVELQKQLDAVACHYIFGRSTNAAPC